jgi:epoxyqueuosine reductase QueG
LVVLGNTASADDAAASTTIERYRHDPDPMLRSHADWAAARVASRT